MSRRKIHYVIDAMEEGKLPVRKQWALAIQRDILPRIYEPRYHRPRWLDALARGSSDPRTQITALPYSPETVEEIRRRAEEWNSAGMELLELIQRWANQSSTPLPSLRRKE